jgi:hypothetical protein
MLRYLLALLACLETAAGPAGSTAALPQIFPMRPVTTPHPSVDGFGYWNFTELGIPHPPGESCQ